MPDPAPKSRYLRLALIALGVAILAFPGASVYYEYSGGKACARCHEIWQPYSDWHTSTHRNIPCGACHGDVFTLEAGFHINNMRRVFNHLSGDVPEQVRLKTRDVFRVTERCKTCHQQEWAEWASGLHHAAYKEVFLDAKHNHRAPADGRLPALPRHALRRQHSRLGDAHRYARTLEAARPRACGPARHRLFELPRHAPPRRSPGAAGGKTCRRARPRN